VRFDDLRPDPYRESSRRRIQIQIPTMTHDELEVEGLRNLKK
jgi:hypothetical protein